jgi:hypothetical protein
MPIDRLHYGLRISPLRPACRAALHQKSFLKVILLTYNYNAAITIENIQKSLQLHVKKIFIFFKEL